MRGHDGPKYEVDASKKRTSRTSDCARPSIRWADCKIAAQRAVSLRRRLKEIAHRVASFQMGIATQPEHVQYFCTIQKHPQMTIETTYSQAREQLKALMDRAVDDREVIVVRRRAGGDVAIIAADELESLVETAHLLRSTKNAERLLSALSRARSNSLKPTKLSELHKQVGLDA